MATKRQSLKPETVIARTGKPIEHWLKVLDKFNVAKSGHKAAAKMLEEKHGVSSWWAQSLTVQYEQEHGLRVPLQRSDKLFATTVSRTVKTTLEKAWSAWADAKTLSQWFTSQHEHDFRVGGRYKNADNDCGEYLKIEPKKRIVFTWEQKIHQPGSRVEVAFARKDANRVTIGLGHSRLQTKKDAENLKEGWSWAMDCLKSYLETGKKITWDEWKAAGR